MIESGYIILGIAALIIVAASALCFFLNKFLEKHISYWLRQIIIGVLFGGLAILGTEWGISIDGAMVNCRDAAVLSAGLLFGGPAGIIAGIIGGVERFVAVAWGVGVYTQVACSSSTLLAGIFAAFIRHRVLDDEVPSWSLAFLSTLVIEAFHLIMVFLTHLDDVASALAVVLVCAAPMLIYNPCAVMLATVVVTAAKNGGIKRVSKDKKSVLITIQNRLLISFVIAFCLFSFLGYSVETIVCTTANDQFLVQTIKQARSIDYNAISTYAELANNGETLYKEFGDTGYLLVSDKDTGEVLSGPMGTVEKTMDELGLSQTGEMNMYGRSDMYEANVQGEACQCMDAYEQGYRLTAVYPMAEGYLDRDRALILSLLVQIMLFAVAYVLVYYFMNQHVIRPVMRMSKSLDKIKKGKLDTVVNVRSNLEFVLLSDGINATVDALKSYMREEQERLDADLKLAKTIQHSALPSHFPPYPNRKEFDIFACMDTAREVGGDFYDFYFVMPNVLNFLVADVSGKGVPAALFMMASKTQIKSMALTGVVVDRLMDLANKAICTDNESGMFITAWQGSINTQSGLVTYANAGHNPPVIRHGNGEFEYLHGKHNPFLGARNNTVYEKQELQLDPGDILFLYTDGVTEANNTHYELYGDDRLLNCLNNIEFDSMEQLCKAVREDVAKFVGEANQADDITMLAIQYFGPSHEHDDENTDRASASTQNDGASKQGAAANKKQDAATSRQDDSAIK